MVSLKTPLDIITLVERKARESDQNYALRCVRLALQANLPRVVEAAQQMVVQAGELRSTHADEYANMSIELQVLDEQIKNWLDKVK